MGALSCKRMNYLERCLYRPTFLGRIYPRRLPTGRIFPLIGSRRNLVAYLGLSCVKGHEFWVEFIHGLVRGGGFFSVYKLSTFVSWTSSF